ncbi:MAG: dTDP-4-dehydrorhamnose 3,5-epimerase [Negativicutes bacterium]|nr:dTDP-4-dehydrorhamnose 3,5-epimerase [Negativicutes bacterium]
MRVSQTNLPGVLLIEPKVFDDSRGFFLETWRKEKYAHFGIPTDFVQDNLSFSRKGVLRGLHFQNPNQQGKLVAVVAGEVYDVVVDIRVGSPTFGQWTGVTLSGDNHRQLWIPGGFAHGFCVVSETAYFVYKCTDVYNPAAEGGIAWNDPDLGINWPLTDVLVSGKDAEYPLLCDIPPEKLPVYHTG